MQLIITRSILLGLTLLGGYAIHAFSQSNGFWELMTQFKDQRRLPNQGLIYDSDVFTRVPQIDDFLCMLVTFFWPCTDGNHPGLSLVSLLFASQAFAGWTLTMLEGLRQGNSGRMISYTTVYGMMVQTMGFALVGPAYLLLHTYTTTATISTAEDIAIPESALRVLPYSVTLGFIFPTMAMGLPSPQIVSQQNKIYAIALWQAFPLWSQLFQSVLQNTLYGRTTASCAPKTQMRLLRRVYMFALCVSVPITIGVYAISLSAFFFPSLFSATAQPQLVPQHVLVPPDPFNSLTKASTVAEGAFWFIQWDWIVSSAAFLVWALYVKYAGSRQSWTLTGILADLLRSNLLGPMATALTLVWERDEAVLASIEDEKERKIQ